MIEMRNMGGRTETEEALRHYINEVERLRTAIRQSFHCDTEMQATTLLQEALAIRSWPPSAGEDDAG